jgi:hypothetical protein
VHCKLLLEDAINAVFRKHPSVLSSKTILTY